MPNATLSYTIFDAVFQKKVLCDLFAEGQLFVAPFAGVIFIVWP